MNFILKFCQSGNYVQSYGRSLKPDIQYIVKIRARKDHILTSHIPCVIIKNFMKIDH